MQLLAILAITFVLFIIWKYWTLLIGAGYDPTPTARVHKMLELAKINEHDVVYDLGCGDGRILIAAAKKYDVQAVGIEIDPFRFIFSWLKILFSGQHKKIKLRYGNLFRMEISDATVVTLFLYQPANNKLKEKFIKELKPGTRIVSYTWTFDEWEPRDYLSDDNIFLYVV